MNNQIFKIGFEIEGGFTSSLETKLNSIGQMVGDGSVRCSNYVMRAREFNSVPYLLKDIDKALKVIDLFDKDNYEFNSSAGFHIHFSFTPALPVTILSIQFFKYFKEAIKRDWPEVVKVRGDNSYCKLKMTKDELNRNSGVERYRAINTWPSYRERKTIEFRIWPTADSETMKKYLLWNVETINNWLINEEKLATEKISFRLTKSISKPIVKDIVRLVNNNKIDYQKCVN